MENSADNSDMAAGTCFVVCIPAADMVAVIAADMAAGKSVDTAADYYRNIDCKDQYSAVADYSVKNQKSLDFRHIAENSNSSVR